MSRRTAVIAASVAALLLVAKALAWTVGGASLYSYRHAADGSFEPVNAADAEQRATQLTRAAAWMPGDDEVWRSLGRLAFHLSAKGDSPIARGFLEVCWARLPFAKDLPAGSTSDALARVAIKAYDRAVAANALDSESRFWRVVAEDRFTEAASGDGVLARVDEALAMDPHQPDRLRAAASVALRHGQVETAMGYYTRAFELSAEGLEEAWAALFNVVPRIDRLFEITPRTANAQQRLSRFFADRWRFEQSEKAWRAYREAARLPILTKINDSEAVNPDFAFKLGDQFRDWHIIQVDGAVVTQADSPPARLTVELEDGPANYFHVQQDVPVTPGGRYYLSVRVRVRDETRLARYGIEATHPFGPEEFNAGADCTVSPRDEGVRPCRIGEWTSVDTTFTVPDDLPVLRLRLRRHPGPMDESATATAEFTRVRLIPLPDGPTDAPTGDSDG
ncbi:MAG: hypothetical protein H6684_00405 [Deltaproteobacteria bacterium]|nr:hypothetical protein [Deltaproteobacteria bacterium]